MPVSAEYHGEYAKDIFDYLKENNIRVELDDRNEKLGYRLRESQTRKIPYTLILGEEEMKNNTISYRLYGHTDTTTVSKDEFLKLLKEEIESKKSSK